MTAPVPIDHAPESTAPSPSSAPSSASTPRCPSTRAASACWPATSSRRRATSAFPMAGGRPLLPSRLLPPATRPQRPAAGVLARERPEEPAHRAGEPGPDGSPLKLSVHVFGGADLVPGLARPGRPGAAASCSTPRCPRTIPCAAGRQRACTRGTGPSASRSTRSSGRRCAHAGCPRHRAGRLPLQRGAPGARRARARGREVASGASLDEALDPVRERIVFTTHTPVPAGNETYGLDELLAAFDDLPDRLGVDWETVRDLCRVAPVTPARPPGMTPLALRTSRTRNGVSRLHGEVSPVACGSRCSPEARGPTSRSRTSRTAPTSRRFVCPPVRRAVRPTTSATSGGSGPRARRLWERVLEIPEHRALGSPALRTRAR